MDPGFNDSASSSKYFALAMVQLAEHAPLNELVKVRQLLHLSTSFELKYYKTTPRQKEIFFKTIRPVSFRVRAVVINKEHLAKSYHSMRGQDIMAEFISRLILRASPLDIAHDILIIDGATHPLLKATRIQLSAECRRVRRTRPFGKIVSGESKRDDCLQLADMIAGAIRQYVMEGQDDYYKLFADKVVDLWLVK
ncbi:MAG: DUF3800 domain-containing protein [Chloroflexi bacterium]|nr:DUF3800 domain-containing protein [Chloroflexota bacterium]